jgi:hypothetical protein
MALRRTNYTENARLTSPFNVFGNISFQVVVVMGLLHIEEEYQRSPFNKL